MKLTKFPVSYLKLSYIFVNRDMPDTIRRQYAVIKKPACFTYKEWKYFLRHIDNMIYKFAINTHKKPWGDNMNLEEVVNRVMEEYWEVKEALERQAFDELPLELADLSNTSLMLFANIPENKG